MSAGFALDEALPLETLEAWIDESYRNIAPKRVVATLGAPRVWTPTFGDGAEG